MRRASPPPPGTSHPLRTLAFFALLVTVLFTAVCARPEIVAPSATPSLPVVASVAQDTTPKEEQRLVPAEAYVRTYLSLFGGLAPVEVQSRARGADGALLFDTWDDYLAALGLPDYRVDIPRGTQTNAVMLATFERLGAALCARALEHDWKATPMLPVARRLVYAFDPNSEPFAAGFDVLHRTFLGYPASLAPTDRAARYARLFEGVRARHAGSPDAAATGARNVGPDASGVSVTPAVAPAAPSSAPKTRLSPAESAWVAVCEGLIRHPELHLY